MTDYPGLGTCLISIEITLTSRVDVDAVANRNTDTALACEFAEKAAKLIEPKLPKE